MRTRAFLLGLTSVLAASTAFAGNRSAQPAPLPAPSAPALSAAALRTEAQDALARIVVSLDAPTRAPLVGAYVAFETGGAEVNALAACDDDGDPVVVVSDALLALVDFASVARAMDDALGTSKVDEYARFLGTQPAGARVLPPPPGFFDASATHDPRVVAHETPRRRAMIDALVAAEIAHFALHDVACPHPTATVESGDGTWTDAEMRASRDLAAHVYTPERVAAADAFAARTLVALDEPHEIKVGAPSRAPIDATDVAYAAILTLLDRIPGTTYARFHGAPPVAARIAAVHAAATSARGGAGAP